MEDVLDVYAEPYDVRRPQVCFDEKQLQGNLSRKGCVPIRGTMGCHEFL
jgi:hypothetical protein